MSWSFKVGMKVVCVDDDWSGLSDCLTGVPKMGGVYEISLISSSRRVDALILALVEFPMSRLDDGQYGQVGWSAESFRPLVDQGMKTLQGLLAPSPAKTPERVS